MFYKNLIASNLIKSHGSQFLKDKNRPYGFRFSLENFSEYEEVKVYPLYAVGNFVMGHIPTI
jgi:hypothetical protein